VFFWWFSLSFLNWALEKKTGVFLGWVQVHQP